MKREHEIREKLEEYLYTYLPQARQCHDDERHEAYCNIIDALLWVLDDESGKQI